MTLVDSNVLIDIWTDDPQWYDWSLTKLNEAGRNGPLLINDVIYAETSVGFLSPKISMQLWSTRELQSRLCLESPYSMRVKLSQNIAVVAEFVPACCRIFSLALMRWWNVYRC